MISCTDNLTIQEIESPNPQAVLIMLHGLGGSNLNLLPLANEIQNVSQLSLHIILPQAPIMPVTINNGLQMPAWYDILSLQRNGNIDLNGIGCSSQKIWNIILTVRQHSILGTKKIFLAGFSQGAVISLATMLAYHRELSGIIALSGYLPFKDIPPARDDAIPIFMAHGTEDDIVDYTSGYTAYSALKNANYPVNWHQYPIAHTISRTEIKDLSTWLVQQTLK